MKRRVAAALAAAGLLAIVTAQPAHAEAKGRIVGISPSDGTLQVSFSVAGLAPGQNIDLDAVGLTLAGQPLDVTAASAADAPAAKVVRSVMLTIDTSGSMRGPGITGARAAAAACACRRGGGCAGGWARG